MKISDIIFVGTLCIVMLILFILIIFNIKIPYLLNFWWVILFPVVVIKIFFKDTKIDNWLNKEIW